jgi:outer membrane protein TolC
MKETALVRDDLSITEMLAAATRYRPDLEAVRKLLQAAQADKSATVCGDLGPQFQASYTFAGLAAHTTGQDDTLHEQQRVAGTAGFALGASTFGEVNTANANRNAASLNVESALDRIRAEVVSAHQASITAAKLIPIALQQVSSAEEALRLTEQDLKSGTGLTVDVLQAQAAADQARYRYASAIVHYNQSEVNLLTALGLIDQTSLLPLRAANPAPPERRPLG